MDRYSSLCSILVLAVAAAMASAQFPAKPWPSYSLQNMPHTDFTCRGKILGGYYADAETQCQMFHVCVKVAGVGVQDFRFLCPNGTAFDQEAQTCADWGDVDCEQATLYYGSDNFDLYRIGSGFESKRAPQSNGGNGGGNAGGSSSSSGSGNSFGAAGSARTATTTGGAGAAGAKRIAAAADDEEPTFHLQRAESNDARRSKLTFVGGHHPSSSSSSSSPAAAASYSGGDKTFNAAAAPAHHNQFQAHANKPSSAPSSSSSIAAKPATNFVNRYTAEPLAVRAAPSTTTTTTTSTTRAPITTSRPVAPAYVRPASPPVVQQHHNNNHRVSAVEREIDDIFKGSHSSNFFNNRHGKDDDDEDAFAKTAYKPQPQHSTTTSRSNSLTGRGRSAHRGRVHYRPDGQLNELESRSGGRQRGTTTTTTTTTLSPTVRPFSTTTTTGFAVHQRVSNYQKTAPQKQQQQSFQGQRIEATTVKQQQQQQQLNNKLKPSEPFPANHQFQFNAQPQQQQQQQRPTSTERAASVIQSTTRQDPFKVTYNQNGGNQFINKQADRFNFELNRAFESQPQFRPPTTTTSRPIQTTSTPAFTTTSRNAVASFVAFNNHLQAPANMEEFIDVFKIRPSPPHNQHNQHNTTASISQNFFSSAALSAEPTKQQRDNFNNLERTVHQLQNSVNRAFGTEPRTLLSSFSLAPPTPTTYNPHLYTARQQTSTSTTTTTTTAAPIVTSSPRGFAATIATNSNNINRFPSRSSSASSNENYTPSSVKKFSTLVPRDQYNPTTFKPAPGGGSADTGSKLFLQEAQQIVSRNSHHHQHQHGLGNSKYLHTINFAQPSTTTTTTTTSTFAPYFFTSTAAQYTTTLAPPATVRTTQRPVATTTTTPKTTTAAPQVAFNNAFNGFNAYNAFNNYQPQTTTTSTTTSAPIASTRFPPLGDDDEDDGQYRPELYEQDFAKNKLKRLREQQQTQKPQQQQQQQQLSQASSSLKAQQNNNHIVSQPRPFNQVSHNQVHSGEDELLNTAHSQNIAASRNELQRTLLNAQQQQLQQQQEKQQQQQQKPRGVLRPLQTSRPATVHPNNNKAPTIPPPSGKAKATHNGGKNKPASAHRDDKDASYDYAYYDSGNENAQNEKEYSEYGFITEFGRTASHSSSSQ